MPDTHDAALHNALASHHGFVQALARQLTHDPNEADDLVQETFLTTLRKRPGTESGSLGPWLGRVLRSHLWTRRREAARRKEREVRSARPESLPDGADALARRLEMQQAIVEAVLSLDEPYRGTILLRYYEEVSLSAIAERQDVPLETVRTRLRRAHEQLRSRLGERGGAQRYALLAGPAMKLVGAAGVAVLAGGVWSFFQEEGAERDEFTLGQARTSAAAPEVPAALAVANADQEQAAKRTALAPTPELLAKRGYWATVRESRAGASRFEVERFVAEEDLHLQQAIESFELAGFRSDDNEGLRARVRQIARLTGFDIVTSERPRTEARLVFEVRHTITLAQLLDLVACEAGPEFDWSVREGTIRVAQQKEVVTEPVAFFHRIDDLLLEPKEHFGELDPHPLFERVSPGAIQTLVKERVDRWSWDLPEVRCDFDPDPEDLRNELGDAYDERDYVPQALYVRHLPQVHVEVQRVLDHLRSFYMPDPEEGRPGRAVPRLETPLRSEREREHDALIDRTMMDVLYAGVSWERVWGDIEQATGIEVYVADSFRPRLDEAVSLEAMQGSVREVLHALERTDGDVRWRLAFGRLVVERGRHAFAGRERLLLRDLRDLFDPPRVPAAALPFGGERPEVWSELEGPAWDEPLSADVFEDYVREVVAPDSWDPNSSHRLRLGDFQVLHLTHTPRVLAEVEALLETLRSAR